MSKILLRAGASVLLCACVIVVGANGFGGAMAYTEGDYGQATFEKLQSFDRVSASEGTDVTLRHGAEHSIELNSRAAVATSFSVNDGRIVIECAEPCGRGSRGEVIVTMPTIRAVTASTGATVEVEDGFGRVDTLSVSASTGGEVDARAIIVETVSASASTGGGVKVQVRDAIFGSASTGGSVRYWGKPTDVKLQKSTGGSVRNAG